MTGGAVAAERIGYVSAYALSPVKDNAIARHKRGDADPRQAPRRSARGSRHGRTTQSVIVVMLPNLQTLMTLRTSFETR